MDLLLRSTGEDGGAAFFDRLTSSLSNKSPLESHNYCQRACAHRQCDRVFREKAHLWHHCHNPESNEHCLMILSVSMTVDGFSISWSSLGKWNSYDRWRVYLIGDTRETSHPIVIVWDGYLTVSTQAWCSLIATNFSQWISNTLWHTRELSIE